MRQAWICLSFLHWPCPPADVRPLLPAGLELDTFDGVAWIGLVPFCITGLTPPRWPALPWVSHFLETNVRTYVIGPGGRRGVWFFSLDAARLAAVAGARATFALPYYWSRMRLEKKDSRIRYFSARRARNPVGCEIAIETGAPIEKPGDFEIFLTARFRLYAERRAQLLEAEVAHEPWRLHQARVLSWNESLFAAAGLPAAQGAPHVLYSPWIDVIVGKPHPAAIYS